MKKIFIFIIVTFLAIGLTSAQNIDAGSAGAESGAMDSGEGASESMQNESGDGETATVGGPEARIRGEGQLTFESGQTMRFSEEGERLRLQTGEHSAECIGCNLSQENGKLKATMSNGRNAEIKVMPDQASENALQRLRMKSCNGNCSIELKEVGSGENIKMAYEVKTQKKAKLFGIFEANMRVQAQVDAETGEIITSKKSWWAFMASEEDETEE